MNRFKIAAATVVAAVSTLVPLGIGGAAHADTTRDGCTVNPLPPEFRQTSNPQNLPYVYYPYEVSCVASPGGLSVEVFTETWESDRDGWVGDVDADGVNNADEDRIGSATSTRSFGAAGGSTTVDIRGVLKHTDTDFNEENYHAVKFRVTSGTVTGGWTTLELTQPTTIGW